jgi:hypothetical protein
MREPAGVIESIDDSYKYTSPLARDAATWMAGYTCRLCYNGKFICSVGHHIVASNYKDKPWAEVLEIDFASPELPRSVEQLIQTLFEKIPEYYRKLATLIA